MPFAGYKDWDQCISKNKDKDNPEAYCGYIKNKVEGSKKEGYDFRLSIEEDLSDACWDGYEAIGFKMKNGKKVPNCVPISENRVPIYLSKNLLEKEGYKKMKKYKSLFEENNKLEVRSKHDAMEIVDISNLIWSKDVESMEQDEAIDNCPAGYRLPTVQELYSAYKLKARNFKPSAYWSSNITMASNIGWAVNFNNGAITGEDIENSLNVCYVKN